MNLRYKFIYKSLIITLLAMFVVVGSALGRSNDKQVAERNSLIAVRSNLLVPALNVGVEYPLGTNWSVAADYYFPWIKMGDKNRNCFQMLGWSAEGRYWFGKDRSMAERLHGHSVAVYGAGGYYDFEFDYEGTQGEFVTAGVDYTYAMPIGKKKRLNLEFTLAVGYIHSWGRPYEVLADYGPLFKKDADIKFDYFGPTKAAVSLVVPINLGRRQK